MMKTILILVLVFAALASPAPAGCLRVMSTQELATASLLIARVRVQETDDSDWGEYGQIATLDLVDVIEGDFTLKSVRVLAKSHIACADDYYKKKDEFLVFLELRGGLYHTVNFQFGQFRIEGEVVRGWRNSDGVAVEKPYYSVREEVESIVAGIRNPKPPEEQVAPSQPAPQGVSDADARPKANLTPTKKPKSARERIP
jgi:hypothetical protein